jgi:hypothetical protein
MHESTIKTLFTLRENATSENNAVWRKAFEKADYDLCKKITDNLAKIDDAIFTAIRSLRNDSMSL